MKRTPNRCSAAFGAGTLISVLVGKAFFNSQSDEKKANLRAKYQFTKYQ